MAAIIIRRIEAAQRQPILQELLSLGDDARAVLSLKLDENEAAAKAAKSRVEAATAALIKASANTTVDAPAVAGERKALAEAQAAEKQVQARRDMLTELRRLLAPKPPVAAARSAGGAAAAGHAARGRAGYPAYFAADERVLVLRATKLARHRRVRGMFLFGGGFDMAARCP